MEIAAMLIASQYDGCIRLAIQMAATTMTTPTYVRNPNDHDEDNQPLLASPLLYSPPLRFDELQQEATITYFEHIGQKLPKGEHKESIEQN